MSRGVNKAILIGNLGSDPELKYTPNGIAVASFSLATNERRQDKDGNYKDHTEWHKIVAWRKLAETVGEYLKKGSQVYIEGKIQTRSWEDQNGNKRYQTEIVAQNLQMLGRRPGDMSSHDETMSEPVNEESGSVRDKDDDEDSDLPF